MINLGDLLWGVNPENEKETENEMLEMPEISINCLAICCTSVCTEPPIVSFIGCK